MEISEIKRELDDYCKNIKQDCDNCRIKKTCDKVNPFVTWAGAPDSIALEAYRVLHGDDAVNHPAHYCREGAMECIDEMILIFGVEETKSYCKLNAWKYRARAPFKGNMEQDMKKSDWYIKKYKELCDDTTQDKVTFTW